MAIQNITYSDKVDLNTTSVANINKVKATDMNEIKSVVNNNANFIGKTLWEGSFTSGELVVPGIHEYTMICVFIGSVMMIGNQLYGGLTYRTYQSTTVSYFGYRFDYDSSTDKLTTTVNNPGATDGTTQQTITKIVGLF